MKKIPIALIFTLAAFIHIGQVDAQSWPQPCTPVALSPNGSNLKSANTVYLRFIESRFPEEFTSPYNPSDVIRDLRNLMRSALTEAALKWNRSCGHPPILNDQPILVPTNSAFEIPAETSGVFLVDVSFDPGMAPGDPEACEKPFETEFCRKDVARSLIRQDGADLVIYGKSGRETDPDWTLFDYRGAYHRLFTHELGHMLLLNHDSCPKSPVQIPIPNRFHCAPYDNTCELSARPEHCDTMEASFEPLDPLDKVLGDDPLLLCRLRHYCDIDPSEGVNGYETRGLRYLGTFGSSQSKAQGTVRAAFRLSWFSVVGARGGAIGGLIHTSAGGRCTRGSRFLKRCGVLR